MKKMKKIVSLLLAMMMVFAMSATAFAADGDEPPYSITINNDKDGHIYEAYQIFTGDLSEKENVKVLSNIVWGTGISTEGQSKLLKFGKTGEDVFANAAKLAASLNDANAVDFANEAAKYLATVAGTSTQSGETYVISGLTAGYYLVKDKNNSLDNANDSYTNYIIKVVGNAEASPKGSIPTVVKKVQEDDKTVTGTTDNRIPNYNLGEKYNDVADYNIGEAVPFELIGTLPSNYAEYITYQYIFHDTLSSGLSYNEQSLNVYYDNGTEGLVNESTLLPLSGYETDYDANTGKLTITFENLKTNNNINANTKIIVKYTATLTSGAEVGLDGNENTVYLQFSNNPNADGSGDTGNTPIDKVIVFTYGLDVIKVAADNNEAKLEGAEFKLLNSAQSQAANVVGGKFVGWVEVSRGTVLTSNAQGEFVIEGLDAGTYYLKETKAPVGYNLLESPVKLVITATTVNNQAWGGTPSAALTALTITVGEGEKAKTEAGNVSTGIVNVTVENNKGATLPSTGGMGTTLFYVVGLTMMFAAAGSFVARRRMAF